MKTVIKYLKPYFNRMTLGLFIKITGTMVELLLPYILSHILKNVVAAGELKNILSWGALMIVCAATALLCNIIANRMAARVSRDFSESVRRDLFKKTLSLSSKQLDRFTIPSLESRITTDTYHVHNFVSMMQRMGVRAPFLLIGGITITLIMDSFLALVMISILPLIFITVYYISKKGVPLYTKVQNSVDKMVRVVREDSQGIRVIKALSKEPFEHKRYDRVNNALARDEKRAGITMGAVNPIMTALMNGGIVAVVALSASRVSAGLSDPETVIAFMQYFTLISMAMMSVTRIFVMFTKCAASAKRIAEVLDTEPDLAVLDKKDYPDIESSAHIEFKDVCFSYEGVKNDIENISFSLEKGQSLGIIGATGSGKSTLLKLLLRFFDVRSGGIYINGENIRTIDQDRLSSFFGTAMQNDFLYSDSVFENIRFGRDLDEEQIRAAAKIAQAEDFIEGFPEKYEHTLSQKATNISGGQKQRLLIARAIAANPDILILDDSSSALDYKTDASLRSALKTSLPSSTVITVAQRVSSVKDCDLILVVDEGRIIGSGKHSELLETCPPYSEIASSQMGGAIIE